MFAFECPACGRSLKAKEEHAGKRGKCGCGAEVTIPEPARASHDVFISHSSRDRVTADLVCSALEKRGLRCWIAPRDIVPGAEWGEAILGGLSQSELMVLIFSSAANSSKHVLREVERAVHRNMVIVPFRIENADLSKSLEYFLSAHQWQDASAPPIERHLRTLCDTVSSVATSKTGAAAVPPPDARPPKIGWDEAVKKAGIAYRWEDRFDGDNIPWPEVNYETIKILLADSELRIVCPGAATGNVSLGDEFGTPGGFEIDMRCIAGGDTPRGAMLSDPDGYESLELLLTGREATVVHRRDQERTEIWRGPLPSPVDPADPWTSVGVIRTSDSILWFVNKVLMADIASPIAAESLRIAFHAGSNGTIGYRRLRWYTAREARDEVPTWLTFLRTHGLKETLNEPLHAFMNAEANGVVVSHPAEAEASSQLRISNRNSASRANFTGRGYAAKAPFGARAVFRRRHLDPGSAQYLVNGLVFAKGDGRGGYVHGFRIVETAGVSQDRGFQRCLFAFDLDGSPEVKGFLGVPGGRKGDPWVSISAVAFAGELHVYLGEYFAFSLADRRIGEFDTVYFEVGQRSEVTLCELKLYGNVSIPGS